MDFLALEKTNITVCIPCFFFFNIYRHAVASSWLPRLLGLVVGDVPAGRGESVNNSQTGVDVDSGISEPGGNLTKMFITVFNGVVDYMPHSQG